MAMLNAMNVAKYLLAVVSVFLLGTAAGALMHQAKSGGGYAVPALFAGGGLVAAVIAWKLHGIAGPPKKS